MPAIAKKVFFDRAALDKDRYDRDYMAETIANGGDPVQFVPTKSHQKGDPTTKSPYNQPKAKKIVSIKMMEKHIKGK